VDHTEVRLATKRSAADVPLSVVLKVAPPCVFVSVWLV